MESSELSLSPNPRKEALDVAKVGEIGVTAEQREIIGSVTKFAEYLTDHWPQIDSGEETAVGGDQGVDIASPHELQESIKEQRINYYLSGSLAVMLLSRAERFTAIEDNQIPAIVDEYTQDLPVSTRNILTSFARQIGDLDYVPMDHHKANPNRLKKGGGGPSFDEIPEEGRKALIQGENQIKLMCDPVEAYGPKRVAHIQVDGREYLIARPDTIFAYKVLHLLQSYDKKPDKFNADFHKLFSALKEIYSEEELMQITQQVLEDYEDAMEGVHARIYEDKENPPLYEKKIPAFINNALINPQITPEIKTVLERLRK